MLIFKLESQTTDEVTKILQNLISLNIYKNLFPIILTDNGHEFFDVDNIECIQVTGEYCYSFIFLWFTYVLPKGSSFKNIMQEDCDLLADNINSLCRDSLNGKSPYEAMLFLFDVSILKLLNCYYIKTNEVVLNHSLLNH